MGFWVGQPLEYQSLFTSQLLKSKRLCFGVGLAVVVVLGVALGVLLGVGVALGVALGVLVVNIGQVLLHNPAVLRYTLDKSVLYTGIDVELPAELVQLIIPLDIDPVPNIPGAVDPTQLRVEFVNGLFKDPLFAIVAAATASE